MSETNRKVEIGAETILFDDFFKIKAGDVRIQHSSGEWTRTRRMLSLERGDAVAAVVVDPRKRAAFFVRQFRYPTHADGPGWVEEIVAGMLDAGETPEAMMRRELVEEIGFEAVRLKEISRFYVSPGGSSERILLFYAEIDSRNPAGAGGGLLESGESVDIIERPLAELPDLLAQGAFEDAKTIIGLQWLLAQPAFDEATDAQEGALAQP